MPEFIMIMKVQPSQNTPNHDWQTYIEQLVKTGMFRGGSAFGNGRSYSSKTTNTECVASGFMRFEAKSIEEIEPLVIDNPVYKTGGEIELHELVLT